MITCLRDQLLRDEGLRLRPYLDTEGKVTIGVGRCIDTNPFTVDEIAAICGAPLSHDAAVEWIETRGITRDHALMLLDRDIATTERALLDAQPWMGTDLDEIRRAAMINMAFNLGVAGVGRFRRMLLALRGGMWSAAASEMLDSRWARQVGARAERLARQVETGEWV